MKAIRYTSIENPVLVKKIWSCYSQAFHGCEKLCAQDQMAFGYERFCEVLSDPNYTKITVEDQGKVVGVCLLTANSTDFSDAYASGAFLIERFPKTVAENRLYYVTAIAIDPSLQGLKHGTTLLIDVIKFISEMNAAVAFDFSKNKNSWLPNAIISAGRSIGKNIERVNLDEQVYVALNFDDAPLN